MVSDPRAGIALVIVLGMLAVITTLAVGFAVSMRTERLATRNYVDSVRSRMLMNAALARAMEEVDNNIGDDVYTSGSKWPLYALSSKTGSRTCSGLVTNRSITSSYIPAQLHGDVWNQPVKWDPLIVPNLKSTNYYAFLAVDCSGFLDPNHVTGKTRKYGLEPAEIPFPQTFPDFNADTIKDYRAYWVRFETLAEFNELGKKKVTALPAQPPIKVNQQYSFFFFPFSYFPLGRDGERSNDLVCIVSNSMLEGATQGRVQGQLEKMKTEAGLAIPDTAMFMQNMIDYVDPGNVPKKLDSICTEPVPMINEVIVDNKFTLDGTKVKNEYRIRIEFWYPFVGKQNNNSYLVRFAAPYTSKFSDLNPATPQPNSIALSKASWSAGDYFVVESAWSPAEHDFEDDPLPIPADFADTVVQVSVRFFESGAGGGEVDWAGMDKNSLLEIPIGLAIKDSAVLFDTEFHYGIAANDPRINWNGKNLSQWKPVKETTPGDKNSTCTCPESDGWKMYVANSGIQSVGELSFLLYDATKPWTTVPIRGDNLMPFFDYFTVTTNFFSRGLVNPNSDMNEVLSAAFLGMPIEEYPGSGGALVAAEQADKLAVELKKVQPIKSISELGKISDAAIDAAFDPVVLNPLKKDSLIRNSVHLFSPRQQIFTIFLAVQAKSETGETVGEQRAVAVVWRDPYKDENGLHRMFVRQFKWLWD